MNTFKKTRTNHKRGIKAGKKAKRREEAEARSAKYAKLSYEEKFDRASAKVRAKLQRGALR